MSARGPHHQLRPDPLATAPDRFVPVPAEVIHPHVGAHALLTASPVRRASSAADLATLRQRYPHEPTARIAADMGRTVRTVYGAALHRAVVRVTGGAS